MLTVNHLTGFGGVPAAGAVADYDPYWANCALLLQPLSGDAAIIDRSPSPKTVTSATGVTLAADAPFSGGQSLSGAGTTSRLRVANASDLAFGTGDFYIRCWYRNDGFALGSDIWSNGSTSYGASELWFFVRASGGAGRLELSSGSTGYYAGAAYNIAGGGWRFLEIGRQSGTLYAFVDGQLDGSVACSANFTNASADWCAFNWSNGAGRDAAKIAALQVYKGVCLHTAAHPVPTARFPLTS